MEEDTEWKDKELKLLYCADDVLLTAQNENDLRRLNLFHKCLRRPGEDSGKISGVGMTSKN